MFEKAGEKASSTRVGAVDRRLYFKRVLSSRAHLGLRCCLDLAVLSGSGCVVRAGTGRVDSQLSYPPRWVSFFTTFSKRLLFSLSLC